MTDTATLAPDADPALRPRTFADYIGQARIKNRLDVIVEGARRRAEPLPPMLFVGPPGMGKTSLAGIAASMTGDPFVEHRGRLTPKELLNSLWRIGGHGVVLLDELHRWREDAQEMLLPLLEDRFLDTPGGPAPFPWITVCAATTARGRIIDPLRDRFGPPFEWEAYTYEELGTIVMNMADRLGIDIVVRDAVDFAVASAGSTRTSTYLLKAYRNLWAYHDRRPTVDEVLDHTDISRDGLTKPHRDFLRALVLLGGNGGMKRLAGVLRIDDAAVLKISYLLIDRGLVIPGAGSQGLMLTMDGRTRLDQEGR